MVKFQYKTMNKYLVGMVIIVATLLVVGLVISNSTNKETENNSDTLKWNDNLDQAIQEAKATNKTVFVDLYADWCTYCGEMDKNTFTSPEVQEKLSQNYVLVKIDVDKNPGPSSKYQAYSLPTMLILDSEGNEIKRIVGYQSPEKLLSQI
jgi:thiol:disulfide interchange protein DsbD